MHYSKGLSLIELMIAVAISAILLTVGAPSLQTLLQQNRVIAATNDISSAARTARFQAIDREQTVIFCSTADYANCSSDWSLAKMVFVDIDDDGGRDVNEQLILATDPTGSGIDVVGIGNAVIFTPDGSVSQSGTVVICPSSGDVKSASAVLISLFGRIAVATDSDNNGVKEDINGNDLTCS
ncbi:GspH/FimT family pseudopilin [Aestuariibacter sp. A3R04]|uniref:GspH/FimT family pseudopilin n=1 Tax=Aestuariibacter sp. A3R04 TaxID=2841571 RepID=UPI001C0A5E6D|nr:GspH/FimT family pseudopilin [Aestuariibacter sp. A3R04]MBU3021868.1 GspH/FimT family pseudopilin [Aestuariibacter sp. A3R04]